MGARLLHILVFTPCLLFSGCNTKPDSLSPGSGKTETTGIQAESLLLDLAIVNFNTGIEDTVSEKAGIYPDVRRAEARYLPYQLSGILQSTGVWGAVRVVPDKLSPTDIWIHGEIIKSNGYELQLRITVVDSSGATWMRKKYEGKTSK